MAEPLKNAINAAVIGQIGEDLRRAGHAQKTIDTFITRSTAGLDGLELLERGRHVGVALRSVLPSDEQQALSSVVAILGPELESHEQFGMAPFRYLPHVSLIAELGPRHPQLGLHACREVTKRFTAEWCIRPLLEAHPDIVFRALSEWTTDPSVHIRRLVSEGTRPRLPWAPRLHWEPRFLELLEALKDDPTEYVRRSVANHLGDVAKEDIAIVLERASRWLSSADDKQRLTRERLVRHALRHPIKQGHRGALDLLGFPAAALVCVENITVPAQIHLGETLHYSFDVCNSSEQEQMIVIDVVIRYQKARGKSTCKVFKLTTTALAPAERRTLSGTLAMRDLSTRRHYPGEHSLAVQINGERHPATAFALLP